MPKTSRSKTVRSKTTKVAAKKKKVSASKKPLLKVYVAERETFFQSNPYIRVLLGLFIVSFAILIGTMYYNKAVLADVYRYLNFESQY